MLVERTRARVKIDRSRPCPLGCHDAVLGAGGPRPASKAQPGPGMPGDEQVWVDVTEWAFET